MIAQKRGDEVIETLNESGIGIVEALDQESRVEFLALGDQGSDNSDTEGLTHDPTEIEQPRCCRSLFRCNVARGIIHGGQKKESLAEADHDHGQTKAVGLPRRRDSTGK